MIAILNALWELFELSVTLFESFMICYFICSFLEMNFSNSKSVKVFVSGGIIFSTLVIVINQLTWFEGIYGIIYSIEYFAFSFFFLNGTILKKAFVSILANVVVMSTTSFASSCAAAALKNNVEILYENNSVIRFILIIIIQAFNAYIFGVILKVTRNKSISLKNNEWALIISVFSVSFVSLIFIHMTLVSAEMASEITVMLFVSELGIIIVNIVCFYMTNALSKSNAEAVEAKSRQQQQEYRIQYADTVEKQYEETRRIRHDMKQNIAALYALHKDGKYDEAQEYLKKYETSLNNIDALIDVGNDALNAILNYKMSIARENNIEIICSCSKGISGIDELDLCALLGNMLDNAIEASEKCPLNNRMILCKLTDDEVKLMVKVENSILSPILNENNQLKTTKQNKDAHGFGVKTIRSIAEKYNGNADFYEEGGNFICSVVMFK